MSEREEAKFSCPRTLGPAPPFVEERVMTMHPLARERLESRDCQFCGYFDAPYAVTLRGPDGSDGEVVRACVEHAEYARRAGNRVERVEPPIYGGGS